jgi:two-component system sensor histidine kinase KdpD
VLLVLLAVAATTLVIYPLREIAPEVSPGVVYLLAVLLVAVYWGLIFGLLTSLVSAAAFNFFHIPPTGRLVIADSAHWVALGVFLVAASVASAVADLARTRAAEAERRQEEADLAAGTARVLLGGATLADALPEAGRLVGAALGLPDAEILLDPATDAMPRSGVVLDLGGGREALLVLAAGVEDDEALRARVRERVAPALEALLRAALDRDRLQAEVVETQALRRSDVIKTALLRAVSHDLRTPLTAIITAGHAVRSPALEGGERDELGLVVVEEAQRLAALVDKLLDLSRLQAGAAEPRRDWCSLEEVVRTAASDVCGEDGASFALSFDPDLPLVQADAAQLERVFVNLLENARRYSGGHPVKVRARVVGGRMSIRVIDRGPGMSATQIDRAFEPFYRDETGDAHAGSGLGLAIVRGFVEANGGRVRAESLPGHGTVFAIELPLVDRPVPATAGERS